MASYQQLQSGLHCYALQIQNPTTPDSRVKRYSCENNPAKMFHQDCDRDLRAASPILPCIVLLRCPRCLIEAVIDVVAYQSMEYLSQVLRFDGNVTYQRSSSLEIVVGVKVGLGRSSYPRRLLLLLLEPLNARPASTYTPCMIPGS